MCVVIDTLCVSRWVAKESSSISSYFLQHRQCVRVQSHVCVQVNPCLWPGALPVAAYVSNPQVWGYDRDFNWDHHSSLVKTISC